MLTEITIRWRNVLGANFFKYAEVAPLLPMVSTADGRLLTRNAGKNFNYKGNSTLSCPLYYHFLIF